MNTLVYVRTLTAIVITAMQVIPIPKVHACKDGGLSKLDVVPLGGGMTGMSSEICRPAMMEPVVGLEFVGAKLSARPGRGKAGKSQINLRMR